MELKNKTFNSSYALTEFVNQQKIHKENIQQIVPYADGYGWVIFWWETR